MNKSVQEFLEFPNSVNFLKIRKNSSLLKEVLIEDEECAKRFFLFDDWLLLFKEGVNLSSEMKALVKENLKGSVIDFADATKYYYSLGYDDRILWQKNYIGFAASVKDLQYVLNQVPSSYRREIVEKMRAVAKTVEEKKIALSYRIWKEWIFAYKNAGWVFHPVFLFNI